MSGQVPLDLIRQVAVLCCAVLCCAVLCCAVLCCAVPCCAVLCCNIWCASYDLRLCVLHLFLGGGGLYGGQMGPGHYKLKGSEQSVGLR